MTPTIRQAIAESLEQLGEEDFLKFCDYLRDRREHPQVSRSAVEGRRRGEVADVIISTFTEQKSRQIVLDLLRQINKNEEANKLELKTKVCVDRGDPHFRRTSKGKLEIQPSEEAVKHAARHSLRPTQHTSSPGEGTAEATACVLSESSDSCTERLSLGKCTLQFGKYKGQTFKWLLENDVSYAVYVLNGHLKEKKFTPNQRNKDLLKKYASAFPEVMEEVRFQCADEEAKERSSRLGQEGEALVGFGVHRRETLKNLYESKNPEKISYVNFLRAMESPNCQRSKMAVRYILQRDQEQA